MTDAELLEEFRATRSQAAFAELVRRHVNWVHAVARRQVRDVHQADDVTQAVFMVLARKTPRLSPGKTLSAWLFPVTNFACRQTFRLEQRRRRHETEAAKMREHSVQRGDEQVQQAQLLGILDQAVESLGYRDRQAVLLRFYEQKSFLEIGDALAISEDAARKRVSRAIEQLRGKMQRRGVHVGAAALAGVLAVNVTSPAPAAVVAALTAESSLAAATAPSIASLVKGGCTMATWLAVKPFAIAAAAIVMIAAIPTIFQITRAQSAPPPQAFSLATRPAAIGATQPTAFGQVLSPDERPVANARVYLPDERSSRDIRLRAMAVSDADGRVELPAVDYDPSASGPPTVLILAPGYGLSMGQWMPDAPADDPNELMLRPATRLKIRVVGPDSRPVVGLRVEPRRIVALREGGVGVLPRELIDQLAATTDAEGVCTLPSLPQGASLEMDIVDDRYAKLSIDDRRELAEAAQTDGGTITLQPAASVSGRLMIAESNRPAAGVEVLVGSQRTGSERAVTDANGNFVAQRLGSGTYSVAISPLDPIGKEYVAVALTDLAVGSGENVTGKDLSLIRGGIIRGRVFVEGTSRPVAGVQINGYGPAHPRGASGVQTTTTDESGIYIQRVAPGENLVGYSSLVPAGAREPDPRNRAVTVAAGETVTVDFVLPASPGMPVSGRVVDDQGRPVPRAIVSAERSSAQMLAPSLTAKSDAQGRFTFDTLEAQSILRASKGRSSTTQQVRITSGNANNITLVLSRNDTVPVVVRAVQEDGTPIPAAKVSLISMHGRSGISTPSDDRLTDVEGYTRFSLKSDSNTVVSINAPGFGNGQKQLTLTPGKTNEFAITLPKADQSIAGMVVDEKGEPIPGISVTVDGGGNGHGPPPPTPMGTFAWRSSLRETNTCMSAKGVAWLSSRRCPPARRMFCLSAPCPPPSPGKQVIAPC